MLCLSRAPLALSLVALFLISTQLKFPPSSQISLTWCQPTRVVPTQSCSVFRTSPFHPLHTSQELASYHIPPPPPDVLHESRSPHMCRYADPVNMSRIGCPLRFNPCSLAQRRVDYICMVQRRASQLIHGINREGKKSGLRGGRREGGKRGEGEENHCRCSTPLKRWLSALPAPTFFLVSWKDFCCFSSKNQTWR